MLRPPVYRDKMNREAFMYILTFDLGTGGLKASLFDEKLNNKFSLFTEYPTYFPKENFHEQKPADWWDALVSSTRAALKETHISPAQVARISLSGASLVPVLLDENNRPLCEYVPIWSDKRAADAADRFFRQIDEKEWYTTTGNGFPPACYPIFKLIWYRENQPEVYGKIAHVLGSKDYINFLLTGNMATDYSYASGSGFYDLRSKKYDKKYLEAAEIPDAWFPSPVASDSVIGSLTEESAAALGLTTETKVVCGGVDNACMALGAIGNADEKAYVSLGTSTWIAVNSALPLLDFKTKPYTFAHIDENLFTSAYSIFAGGNSLRWLRNMLYHQSGKAGSYADMCAEASRSPAGANGVMFHPGLAGGTGLDKSQYIRGGFLGLTLGTEICDLIRATLEGVAFNLRLCLDQLKILTGIDKEIYFSGGGSKNEFWLQIFADVFEHKIARTDAQQETASIGAAAAALKNLCGYKNYDFVNGLQKRNFTCLPDEDNVAKYKKLLPAFKRFNDIAAEYGEWIHNVLNGFAQ